MNSNSLPLALCNLLDAMFPGDDARSLPSFNSLGRDAFDALLNEAEALMPYVQNHAEDFNPSMDVKASLSVLRKVAPQTTHAFIISALEVYFSSPLVISRLREGPAVLFPHARSLPDIDYELLEPVVDRCSRSTRK